MYYKVCFDGGIHIIDEGIFTCDSNDLDFTIFLFNEDILFEHVEKPYSRCSDIVATFDCTYTTSEDNKPVVLITYFSIDCNETEFDFICKNLYKIIQTEVMKKYKVQDKNSITVEMFFNEEETKILESVKDWGSQFEFNYKRNYLTLYS